MVEHICEYEPCSMPFKKNTPWHRFHTIKCHDLWHGDRQKQVTQIMKRLNELEGRIEELEDKNES